MYSTMFRISRIRIVLPMTPALEKTSTTQAQNTEHLICRSAREIQIFIQWASYTFIPKSKSKPLINHNHSCSQFGPYLKHSFIFGDKTGPGLPLIQKLNKELSFGPGKWLIILRHLLPCLRTWLWFLDSCGRRRELSPARPPPSSHTQTYVFVLMCA